MPYLKLGRKEKRAPLTELESINVRSKHPDTKCLPKITQRNGPPAQDGAEFVWSRVEYECDLSHIRSLHIRVTVIIHLAAYADEFLRETAACT